MTLFCPPHWQTREFTKTPALSPGPYSYSLEIKFLDTDHSPVVLWRHVRRRGHHRAQTQPLQPPARRRPSAHLLRQAARHHAPRQPPPVRRRRDRPDPPARHPRPAPRRGTRSQDDPRRRPAGRRPVLPPTSSHRASSPAGTAAARPAKATQTHIAGLPTEKEIAAEVRRRPIGAVIADICRDLGIMPYHPLWTDLSTAILRHGGNLPRLWREIYALFRPRPTADLAPHLARAGAAIPGTRRHRPALMRCNHG